jgi:hypothetical protein
MGSTARAQLTQQLENPHMSPIAIREFEFWLDAMHYCTQHDLPLTSIRRAHFRMWVVEH